MTFKFEFPSFYPSLPSSIRFFMTISCQGNHFSQWRGTLQAEHDDIKPIAQGGSRKKISLIKIIKTQANFK